MIQADDPRLKTAEGWVALGAPKDATRWVGPMKDLGRFMLMAKDLCLIKMLMDGF